MDNEPRPTAIFATNDIVAVGAWSKLLALGFHIPEDVSLMGFDDIQMSQYLIPPLTTVAQRGREIVARAIELLLALMTGNERSDRSPEEFPTSILINPTLIVRGSTGTPKKGKTG
jgi:DNA-binding LacI/PurR family transcriptional regulator